MRDTFHDGYGFAGGDYCVCIGGCRPVRDDDVVDRGILVRREKATQNTVRTWCTRADTQLRWDIGRLQQTRPLDSLTMGRRKRSHHLRQTIIIAVTVEIIEGKMVRSTIRSVAHILITILTREERRERIPRFATELIRDVCHDSSLSFRASCDPMLTRHPEP